MKLLYITNGINGSGGLERVLSIKASLLAEEYGYDVTIATLNEHRHEPFFKFSPKVKFQGFDASGNALSYLFQYSTGLKKLVANLNPDVISVCDDGLKGFFVPKIIGKQIPIIYERHASVAITENKSKISKLKSSLIHFIMKENVGEFKKFVVLTNGNLKEWGNGNMCVIPNPLPLNSTNTSDLSSKRVIAVGSHSYNKGYDLLLQIWSKVEQIFPDWQLDIYGKNYQEKSFGIAKKLQLKKVFFHDPVPNIEEKYLQSSILVLPSRSEGFGMVIIEAMSFGLPVVSFDCPHGPADIITNEVDGFLIENGNCEKFAEKLMMLMNNNDLQIKMGESALKKSKVYDSSKIIDQWEGLFNVLSEKK